MYFKGLIAHDATRSESVLLVAENFFLAHKGIQLAYPDSRLVWLFPVDDDDVPDYLKGRAEETIGRELLDIMRRPD
jgi:tRNA(His) 5'-end guanylyltransferase